MSFAVKVGFDRHTKSERLAGETLVEGGWSIDHHVRTIGDAEVTFRQERDQWLSVTAKQATPMMLDWPGLMCHALSFATSDLMRPALIVRAFNDREDIGLFSGPFHKYRSLMPRPIVGLTPEDADSFWLLVERVFMFAWDRRTSSLQFLEELDTIRAGAAMSIQTACLTLAIGIEALAKELLPAVPAPGWNEEARASLELHIKAWQGDTHQSTSPHSRVQATVEGRSNGRHYLLQREVPLSLYLAQLRRWATVLPLRYAALQLGGSGRSQARQHGLRRMVLRRDPSKRNGRDTA